MSDESRIELIPCSDPRVHIRRAWVSVSSNRSGDPADITIGIETDEPGHLAVDSVTHGGNQTVFGLRLNPPKTSQSPSPASPR